MTFLLTPRRSASAAATAVALILAACGGEPDTAEMEPAVVPPAPTVATVTITQPTDGAVIEGNSVVVMLEVSNLRIVPAGTQEDGTGHHHLVVDADLPAPGAPIPSVPGSYIHMGQAQTELEVTDLASGVHTVIAVVGDAAHVPLDPWVVDTVTFVVR